MSLDSSSLYRCTVAHQRHEVADHQFQYRLNLFCLDLDELHFLNKASLPTGYNNHNIFSIHDADYLHAGKASIKEKLALLFAERGLARQYSKVQRAMLVTAPRYFGYVFNPVSFYLCMDDQERLVFFVAEINNTFGDKHVYILNELGETLDRTGLRREKTFHVSPFHKMEGDYQFRVEHANGNLSICIDIFRKDRKIFSSKLMGESRELSFKSLWLHALTSPLTPWLTMPRILWQAFVLHYFKNVPVYKRPNPMSKDTLRHRPPKFLERRFMKATFRLLANIQTGTLVLDLPDGSYRMFQGKVNRSRRARLSIKSYAFFQKVILGGDVGFGESYEDGDWDSPDLVRLLRLLSDNRTTIKPRRYVAGFILRAFNRLAHLKRKNSLAGSKKNIEEHYDLSNDFFKLWLDKTMLYSAGYFPKQDSSMYEAQQTKLDKIIEHSRIEPTHQVLEIGCGWGSLSIEIAKQTGAHVTGITISQEQYDYACRRVQEEGLEDRVSILFQDYRLIQGKFDRIVSIEMLEAVGEEHLPEFFKKCQSLLSPKGLLFLQVITMAEDRITAYKRGCDWIQKHIFPGCYVPSLSDISRAAANGGFSLAQSEDIGLHYAKTLRHWHTNVLAYREDILRLGFSEKFLRKWFYYLAYCEAGFANRDLGTCQLVFSGRHYRSLYSSDNQMYSCDSEMVS